jgi:hypothetical protein
MGDHWPWEAKELNLQERFNATTAPAMGTAFGPEKPLLLGIAVSPAQRPILHAGRGFALLGTSFTLTLLRRLNGGGSQSHGAPASPTGYNSLEQSQSG